MSEKIGPLTFGSKDEQVFLGKEISKPKDFSEEKSTIIDSEVTKIVQNAENNALNLLNKHIEHLHNLATILLEKETIDGNEMKDLILNGLPKKEIVEQPKERKRRNT